MSLTSVQPHDPFGRRRRIINNAPKGVDSLEDGGEVGSEGHPHFPEVVLSIEEVRAQLQESCFSCGVSWREEHVSLDCGECGGYALSRPCPRCSGRCQTEWRRNLTLSHASGKARWEGVCGLPEDEGAPTAVVLTSLRVLGQVSSEADQLSSRLGALSPISSST
ncbi:protein pinocchio [Hetaerina americana]|uniref:protein pinocchio n=1 Tax=Hetaerina americana TaxID=62018 RepID=UPI003A7F57D4